MAQIRKLKHLTEILSLLSTVECKSPSETNSDNGIIEKKQTLIGQKFDIYDDCREEWWPATVVERMGPLIKVKYDGDSTTAWLGITLHKDKIAPIHKHTKNHETHKVLKTESDKRKKEWNKNSVRFNAYVESTMSSCDCVYYKLSTCMLAMILSDINLSMFELKGNRCFCEKCHIQRKDKDIYRRGNPSQKYVIPKGYARFGIKLPSDNEENILNNWHVVYHGTKSKYVKEISESGLILLKPNDFKLNMKGKNETRSGHILKKFERINKYTGEKEIFNPEQIFTSPSCVYASYYCDKIDIEDCEVSFMFQCRQKPGSYSRGQKTIKSKSDKQIDKWISNDCIEFYTKHNLNIIITGILVKIHNWEFSTPSKRTPSKRAISVKCDDCNGTGIYKSGHCSACSATGIYRKGLICYTCNGNGCFRNRKRCFRCNGSGIYKPFIVCRNCSGSGTYRVQCSKCKGDGTTVVMQ
eukprot:544649_1